MWWLLPTACLAGLAEVIGWSGRLWSSQNPGNLNPFLIQICTTIIAPTPLIASYFVILGRLIEHLGPEYNRIGPSMYTIIFCSADVIALVIQAVGGASASIAVENGNNPAKGGHIMLGGIVFQLVAIVIYSVLASEFLIRVIRGWPVRTPKQSTDEKAELGVSPSASSNLKYLPGGAIDRKTKLMFAGLAFSTLCIFIRSIYRTIELANGWSGRIIGTERYFNFLDGMMVAFAMICLNALHPGWLLPAERRR
ncbi:RTA1 like protein [Sistotremastrum niveocremeum HHB9708]|nr:RTA1 like protein [Sistotremastrum niveocremeum HHB9708]